MQKMSLLTVLLLSVFVGSAQDTTMSNTTRIGSAIMETPQLRTAMAMKTRFGLLAGVNLATYSAKEFTSGATPSTNNKTSYHVGAFVNIPLGAMLKLQPELVYSSQGSKMEEKTTTAGGSRTFNYEDDLDYLNLPVLLQLQTRSGFFVETGPQFSYLLDAKSKGTTPISTTNETDLKPYRDKFDIGWSLGVGYLTRVGLGARVRYNYGLRNIVDENDVNIGELRNRVVQIGLVYQFGAYK